MNAEKGDFRQVKPLRNAGGAPLPDDIADVVQTPNAANVARATAEGDGAYAGAYSFPEQVGAGN